MEAKAFGRVFRRLFSHETCSKLRYSPKGRSSPHPQYGCSQARGLSITPQLYSRQYAKDEDFWQQRSNFFPPDKSKDFEKYPMVTSEDLKSYKERPRRVKMLMRDFIEGTMYWAP